MRRLYAFCALALAILACTPQEFLSPTRQLFAGRPLPLRAVPVVLPAAPARAPRDRAGEEPFAWGPRSGPSEAGTSKVMENLVKLVHMESHMHQDRF